MTGDADTLHEIGLIVLYAAALLGVLVAGYVVVVLIKARGFGGFHVGLGKASLDVLAKEMQPNGGSTMRDAIDRIESKVDSIDGRLTLVEDAVTTPTRRAS
jgi:hypothetical protein